MSRGYGVEQCDCATCAKEKEFYKKYRWVNWTVVITIIIAAVLMSKF